MTASVQKMSLERDLSLVLGRSFRFHSPELSILNPDALKHAYRRRAHELHPDKAVARGLDPEYLSERFKDLQEAFLRVLTDMESGAFFRLIAQTHAEPASRPAASRPAASPQAARNPQAAHAAAPPPAANAARAATPGRSSWPRPSPESLRVYHAGNVPRMKLRIAQYLYYTRRIDWDTLIQSLAWQFHARPKLGELGIELGYLDQSQVLSILRAKRLDETFGDAALRAGYLDRFRLTVLLGRQRLLGLAIGRYFVTNGHINEADLEDAIKALYAHNLSLQADRAAARRRSTGAA